MSDVLLSFFFVALESSKVGGVLSLDPKVP